MALIDYSLIADAVQYYSHLGFQQVEVPWLVGADAILATIPPSHLHGAMMVEARHEYLVGSAEQGFLEINLTPGSYLAVSPCFRAGEVDAWHQETFMKVELHQTDDVSDAALLSMIAKAHAFFIRHANPDHIRRVETVDGWDIEVNGIEVGSYGRRDINGRVWLYGTGLALPRLSQARGGE